MSDILAVKSETVGQFVSETSDASPKISEVISPNAFPADTLSKVDTSDNSEDISKKTDSVSDLESDSVSVQSSATSESAVSPVQSSASTENDSKQSNAEGSGTEAFDLPKNNGPVFNPPMDGSDLKNVSHNNTSELSLLISALEEQQKRTVTTLKTDNSEYTKKLDEIFNPTVPSSEIVPQNENLNTSTIFNEKFQNARSVIDSKLDIVLDAERYLNELRSSAQKLTSADDGQVSSDVSRSIEGISSIVADLTSTKSASSELKAALSKLPSFDEAGNIVNVPEAENKAESSAQSDDVPFELTPQSEELSVDETFAQAQKEALAQLEQDKELENQLKEDAQRLNQSLRDSAINLESVINPQTEAQGKTDLLKNEDDHYIQNLDEPVADAEHSSTMEAEASTKLSKQTSSPSEKNPKEDDKEATVSNTRTGIEVSYVAGYFEGNTKEVTEIIPDRLETLDAVLSEVESTVTSAPESIIESAGNKTVENELSPSLQQAVDAALSGNFGQNLNAATENVATVHPAVSAPSVIAESTESSVSLSSVATESDLAEYPDAVSGGSQNIDSDFTPVNDDDDSEDDSHIETVRVSDLKAVDNSNTSETENNLIDGNPKIVRESTLKLIEAERQFENRRLGRKLEPKDFYYKVEQTDSWFQTILKSGYNDGPVFSALCYSKRTIDPNDQYKWKLQISDDFELMTMAPDFHHNLRTRFSFVLNHPVEIELESFKGIPPGCPEELARMWYIKEIENAKYEISQNEELNSLLSRLGEDLRTLNISIYTQSSLPSNTDK